jgi:hypothetical protein
MWSEELGYPGLQVLLNKEATGGQGTEPHYRALLVSNINRVHLPAG